MTFRFPRPGSDGLNMQPLSTLTRLVLSFLCLLLSNNVFAVNHNLSSVLNLVFTNNGGTVIPGTTIQDVMNNITQIYEAAPADTGAYPSAIIGLFYNTDFTNPKVNSTYWPLIQFMKEKNITIYPSVDYSETGPPTNSPNSTLFRQVVQGYSTFTDCIQVSGEYWANYPNDFISTLTYLNETLGFQHIQLNPWPAINSVGGPLVQFNNPAVDSAFEQVQPNNTSAEWTINAGRIQRIFQANPTAQVVMNYENPPEQLALTNLSVVDQLAAFKTSIESIQCSAWGTNGTNTVHWSAPWSRNYSPWTNGTWKFVVRQLSGKGAYVPRTCLT